MYPIEHTLVILKPDAVRRGLCGDILARFEHKGFVLHGVKMMRMTQTQSREHYAHVAELPFYPELEEYMTGSPSLFAVVAGEKAVSFIRKMVGKTNPLDAEPGTIRGDFGFHPEENLIHASDSLEAAQAEIARFFSADELV